MYLNVLEFHVSDRVATLMCVCGWVGGVGGWGSPPTNLEVARHDGGTNLFRPIVPGDEITPCRETPHFND